MIDILLSRVPAYRSALAMNARLKQENDDLRHENANLKQIQMLQGFLSESERYSLALRLQLERQEIAHISKGGV